MAETQKDIIEKESNREKTVIEESSQEKADATEEHLRLPRTSRFKQLLSTRKGKMITGLGLLVVILLVLFAIPATRYSILGTFLKKSVQITIVDSITNKPVTQATVAIGDKSITTSSSGKAELLDIPVGEYTIVVTKNYYKDTSMGYTVPVLGNPEAKTMSLEATGRQVQVSVTNKVTKSPLAEVAINVGDTAAITDAQGVATIVLPADKQTLPGTLSRRDYNGADVTITVIDQSDANNFALTPSGKLYYLSNQTGKIDVMKANLDGEDAQVVVAGTGNEYTESTTLLAARDWSYLALLARRDSDKKSQLFLLDTKTDSLKLIDEGDVDFGPVGWSDHNFIYQVNRQNKKAWESGRQALKSYNADTGKIVTIDESVASGSNDYDFRAEHLGRPYILEEKVIYTKTWWRGHYSSPADERAAIVESAPDGGNKRVLKEFSMERYANIDQRLYKPQEVYFRVAIDDNQPSFYEYENGKILDISNNDAHFYSQYPTYLISPSGQKVFWYEIRDGKNTLFVGDKNALNGKEIASLSDYSTYGWYSDEYVLLSKDRSELYIAPASVALSDENPPMKVTNYYKPNVSYPGYGYGYGGL